MKTVLAHGVFDVFHAGHLAYLQEAKKYGDRLIVSITSDRFVNKGPGRPYFTAQQRAGMVGALKIVDHVAIVDEPTAISAIELFKPDFYIKGADYQDFAKDVTGEILNEKSAVESYGGELVFTNTPMYSSSTLINKFLQPWTDEQTGQIDKIKSLGGMAAIEKALDRLSSLSVLVIGEPILDVYRFVLPEGISSKSPTVSCRFKNEETYFGGSMAIFAHLQDFCRAQLLKPQTTSRVYPSKVRYIDQTKSQRIFEVTEIWESEWVRRDVKDVLSKGERDCLVVADFGHGLFDEALLEQMRLASGFIGLNVQTNSSNFGFNPYHRHGRWDYLSLDKREAQVALHDRYSSPDDLFRKVHGEEKRVSLTLGSNGSIFFDGSKEHRCPAFSDVVIDATGAGDAYFAITTVLLASQCDPGLIPFIGNVFAGLKTKILGNKTAVSKASLVKALRAILA